jgi:hypothetical protein
MSTPGVAVLLPLAFPLLLLLLLLLMEQVEQPMAGRQQAQTLPSEQLQEAGSPDELEALVTEHFAAALDTYWRSEPSGQSIAAQIGPSGS